jgi:hypothetical protein
MKPNSEAWSKEIAGNEAAGAGWLARLEWPLFLADVADEEQAADGRNEGDLDEGGKGRAAGRTHAENGTIAARAESAFMRRMMA